MLPAPPFSSSACAGGFSAAAAFCYYCYCCYCYWSLDWQISKCEESTVRPLVCSPRSTNSKNSYLPSCLVLSSCWLLSIFRLGSDWPWLDCAAIWTCLARLVTMLLLLHLCEWLLSLSLSLLSWFQKFEYREMTVASLIKFLQSTKISG